MGEHGIGEIQAAVLAALEQLPQRSDVTEAMLRPKTGTAPGSPAESEWHAEFAQWLWRDDRAWQAELEAWKQTAKR